MLRIQSSILLAMLALVFVTGALTAGLVIGLAVEGFWFLAGAAAIGFPALVAWMSHSHLSNRKDHNA